ncbi:MAG: Stk1 family PASTA domain-containing Ser/Thr kinase [Peptococcaceae bacterium]|nr:Stk1 family PASTA domain-containing Ser/Thr kinase [Peptococcaceae bacterium]
MIGRLLGNRYEIVEQLGGGGMAIVFKGKDIILNRWVTIKLLRSEYTSDEEFVRRFRREAQSVASLSHPNIVSIYDVGMEDNLHYLVMEYVDGEDLRSIIKKEGYIQEERAARIVIQICDALEHAHENNIVHRDVKPHNILITRSGRAKLTDFGIAREASTATMTGSDTIIGSVHYLSPEQARGEVAGPKSDIYSLGISFYEMLTGNLPFTGDSAVAIALKHIQEEPQPPGTLKPTISKDVEHVVLRALQKDPEKRYRSIGDMAKQLEDALSDDDSDTTRIIPLNSLEGNILKNGQYQKQRYDHQITPRTSRAYSSKRLTPAGWAIIGSIAVLIIAGIFYWYYNFLNVPETVVPNVIGKNYKEAQEILAALGLESEIVEKYHQSVAEGIVIEQDPSPEGPPIKINRVIELTVSKGADLGTVPNLVKLSLDEAKEKLTEAGYELEEPVKEVPSTEIEKGYVVSQLPDAFSRSPKKTKIVLTVSSGPEVSVKVPDLTGLTLDQAKSRLVENGMELDQSIVYQSSNDYFSGQVISQYPAPNEVLTDKVAVKVVLSNGPGPASREVNVTVSVPNDGKNHQVRISVSDARGNRDAYVSTHNPGDKVKQNITYSGKATIRVYIDDKQIKEEILY